MNDIERVMACLRVQYSGQIRGLHPCWDECAWSRVYRATFHDGTHMFLKGTPRSRNEAQVTQQLHTLCPTDIPRVIATDLSPETDWQWFLLEDAGRCNEEGLSLAIAQEVAYVLGTVQRRATGEHSLASLVVHCEGDRLQERALDVCTWAMEHASAAVGEPVQRIAQAISQAAPFFRETANQLQDLPATIVHGDLWAGNIAVDPVQLIDWADAVWGVGGVSIVHLLLTAHGTLDTVSSAVWDAYGSGLGASIKPAYQAACVVANLVSCLVTDLEIARCCGQGLEMLPGLVPGLKVLATQLIA